MSRYKCLHFNTVTAKRLNIKYISFDISIEFSTYLAELFVQNNVVPSDNNTKTRALVSVNIKS